MSPRRNSAAVGADRVSRIASIESNCAARAQVDAIVGGLEHAGGRHRVLRVERLRRSAAGVNAERRELGVRDLDVDLLLLLAEEIDLGDVGHAQQLGAHAIGVFLQLARSVKPSPVSA